ncbi:MAG: glycosyltransferase family 4 protein [Bryobacteraceae bacterium]
MRPSVAYVITRAEIGGGQSHVLDLLDGFRERMDVHLITGEHGFLTESASSIGVEVHVLPTLVQPMAPRKDVAALAGLVGLFGRINPCLVHAHTSKAGFLARAAAAVRRIPSVFTAHTWCFAEGTSRLWHTIGTPLEKGAGRVCRKIITVSDANRRLAIAHGIPASKIQTVHNGIPDCPHRARPGSDDGPVRILMAARFAPQKDHASLLRAVAPMGDRVEVLLAGDGPLRPAMESLAAELGIANSIRFLGDRRDMPQLLAASHIFVLPTRWEGFPISILEAMRAGLPVVASDAGGVREAVSDGVTGFTTAIGDDAHFAARLRPLVESAAMRGSFGEAARLRYQQNFTDTIMLRRTLSVYKEAVPMWNSRLGPFQEITV